MIFYTGVLKNAPSHKSSLSGGKCAKAHFLRLFSKDGGKPDAMIYAIDGEIFYIR